MFYDKTEKQKNSVQCFRRQSLVKTSAVVIAAAENVMWCFTQASPDE